MAAIYGKAETVYVWLGEESDDSWLAMDFIKNRVLNLKDFDRLIKDEKVIAEWRALSALIKRPWFSRRWIFQEIAVAQQAILLCGQHEIKWQEFADAISLINEVETGTHRISHVMKTDRELGHMPDFFGDVSALSATKLVEVTNNLFRKITRNERQARFSLEYLVSTLTTFESSEPRDTVYAFLAMARDTLPKTTLERSLIEKWGWLEIIKEKFIGQLSKRIISQPYFVDYGLPLSDVYVQFVQWAIEKSDKSQPESLSEEPDSPTYGRVILSQKESPRPLEEGQDTLPSWIPTMARAAFGMDGTGQKMTRKNADASVGLPSDRIYSAAGTRVLTEKFRIEDGVTRSSSDSRLNGLHYHSMFVEGFVLDYVNELKYPSQQGNIPSDWLKLVRWKGRDGQLSDEFWRTLVADRGPTGGNAPRYYPRLVAHALSQGVQGDSLNTGNIVNWGNCSIVGEVLRRVRSTIWNRKMMRTEHEKRLGLAPELARHGDTICILYGCSVPVLLRRCTKTAEEVSEEDQQRQKKEEEKRKEAAKKIIRVWRHFVATRPASSSSLHQAQTKGRKRKRGPGPAEPGHRPKKQLRTRSIHGRTIDEVQAGGGAGTRVDNNGESQGNPEEANATGSGRAALESDPGVYYQLIGECYVDGMMNGEAISSWHTSTLFEIR
ncbi:hypothetical protein AAE478_004693 [Parahypoxylon ruwenzoriense]